MQARHYKKTYTQLGKILASRNPELANELIGKYLHTDRIDDDLTHIPEYYSQFCLYLGITKEEELPSRQRTEYRRLFISVMLRIYNPGVYHQPKKDLVMLNGFGRRLSETINIKQPNLTELIPQVIQDERIYDDYRRRVDEILENILSIKQLKNSGK